MGMIYETLCTPVAYVRKTMHDLRAPKRSMTRIPFGPDGNQAVCFFEPPAPTKRTVVMYFHGGAYQVGTPESMGMVADAFNAQGYRFVSVGFRLLDAAPFPAQAHDAFIGVRTAIEHLEESGIDCGSIVLGGNSAGGHAAALVAFGHDLQSEYGIDGTRIRGLISLAGIGDVDDMFARAPFSAHVDLPGFDASDDAAMHRALAPWSPIELVNGQCRVPTLVLHGAHDKMSPYASQVRFVDRINAACGPGTAQLHTFDSWGYQHILLTVSGFAGNPKTSETVATVFNWMDGLDLPPRP